MELKDLTLSGLRQHRPDLIAEVEKAHDVSAVLVAAKAEGAKAERERVEGIRAALIPGHEKIIEAMIGDATKTEIDAHRAVAAAERQLKTNAVAGLETDEQANKGLRSEHTPANPPAPPKKPAEGLEGEAKYKAEWAADKNLAGEFSSEAAYIAYRAKDDAGQVKILGRRAA